LSILLKQRGYVADAIATVEAAQAIIAREPPDLLVTNVYLPGTRGVDAIRLLKGVCPGLRVLMVSGLPDADVIQEWTSKEGFETFPKPFTAQELLDKIQAVLAD